MILRPPQPHTAHPPPRRHEAPVDKFHRIAVALAAGRVVALDVDVLAAAVVAAAAVGMVVAAAEARGGVAEAEAVGGEVELVVGVGGVGGG